MVLGRAPTNPRNRIWFRCRTQHRWVSGCLSTSERRLADALNNGHAEDVLVADEVSVVDSTGGQERVQAIGHANISRSAILFAVPVEDAPRRPDLLIRSKMPAQRLRVGIGPYEIVGNVHLLEQDRFQDALLAVTRQFVVLAEAVIRRVDDPSFVEEHDAVCVSRQHVDYIGLAAPAGQDAGAGKSRAGAPVGIAR